MAARMNRPAVTSTRMRPIALCKLPVESFSPARNSTSPKISARTQADTEYLARELASVRLTLSDVVTIEELRNVTEKLADALIRLDQRLEMLDVLVPPPDASA